MFRPSSVEPSAESASNFDPDDSTFMLCAPTFTEYRLRNPGLRRAMVWASPNTMRAWSRVVASEYTSAPPSPSAANMYRPRHQRSANVFSTGVPVQAMRNRTLCFFAGRVTKAAGVLIFCASSQTMTDQGG